MKTSQQEKKINTTLLYKHDFLNIFFLLVCLHLKAPFGIIRLGHFSHPHKMKILGMHMIALSQSLPRKNHSLKMKI